MKCERCWKENPADIHTCMPRCAICKGLASHFEAYWLGQEIYLCDKQKCEDEAIQMINDPEFNK